ncbi:MAG: GntR family transcriptional regulator [Candidatus Krumholzibacteria bacterium]|jgi:GntR family transcriptional regulator|nr:GntR family transcriptional regulator [Candidatus Krumholzibacteria bacterium]MDP6669300.1 GntR family transcriptional regulator [Candidatus Krumholzibacteria bacterium]MDP6797326.1 GntR family transcriptional regulator [Candidatus Krumholzibacteria bacterium]MDP7021523.1 GntR family transcriptional regulator [Candidatus Krumholzibacteria bacterium]
MPPQNPPEPSLDTLSGVPIYRQIVDWVKFQVAAGALSPGQQLPTVRQLAVDLGVNVNTISRAYLELERMDLVNTLQGKGTFVALKEVTLDEVMRGLKLREIASELLSRASEFGFSPEELIAEIRKRLPDEKEKS